MVPMWSTRGTEQQGHHLVKEVEGDQIARKADTHQGAQGHEVEAEKPLPVALVVHVLKGKDGHREPDETDESGKQPPQGVRLQHHAEPPG